VVLAKQITYRRVYEETSAKDGRRVLVDRVWPRGMRKEEVDLDEWLRDVALSTELRRWYGHEPSRFAEFCRRYLAELRDSRHRQAAEHLRDRVDHDKLTLLTAAAMTTGSGRNNGWARGPSAVLRVSLR
jgi:uncharacterized protein YeaO (DUF488 family)